MNGEWRDMVNREIVKGVENLPPVKREIAMEDVTSIGLEAMKVVEARLKGFGIVMTPEQEDSVYVPMIDAIERVAGCPDYRSHN